MKIFILEDDSNIRELVLYTLKHQGYEARGFERPSQFFAALEEEYPDLLLLDIMLPEEDGLAVLEKLRENSLTESLPVIMLTAKSSEYDKVLGLDNGADDYLGKPFGMMELMARIKAVMRRSGIKDETDLRAGRVRLLPNKHEVYAGEDEVKLTMKEFELLKDLLLHKNLVVSREQLLSRVWGYDFDGENRTVDVHIRSLRKKLGEHAEIIQTIRGFGYKISETETL